MRGERGHVRRVYGGKGIIFQAFRLHFMHFFQNVRYVDGENFKIDFIDLFLIFPYRHFLVLRFVFYIYYMPKKLTCQRVYACFKVK